MAEYLEHYGVMGMRWGVRKDRNKKRAKVDKYQTRDITTKSGEKLTMERNRGGVIGKALGSVSPSIKKEQDRTYNYQVKNSEGKKVGNFQLYQKPKGEMNIVWGSTKKKYRGRGYMTAIAAEGEKIAKELGNTKITAELVGNSPGDSIHKLGEHRGYVKVGENVTKEMMDAWGGLTLVEKKL